MTRVQLVGYGVAAAPILLAILANSRELGFRETCRWIGIFVCAVAAGFIGGMLVRYGA